MKKNKILKKRYFFTRKACLLVLFFILESLVENLSILSALSNIQFQVCNVFFCCCCCFCLIYSCYDFICFFFFYICLCLLGFSSLIVLLSVLGEVSLVVAPCNLGSLVLTANIPMATILSLSLIIPCIYCYCYQLSVSKSLFSQTWKQTFLCVFLPGGVDWLHESCK